MSDLNKLPLKSKKFLAYLIADFGWKFLIGYVVWEYKNKIDHYAFMVLLAMIVTAGFIQIGYILGQAMLDRYATSVVDLFDGDNDKKDEKQIIKD